MNTENLEELIERYKSQIESNKRRHPQMDAVFEEIKVRMVEALCKPFHIAVIGKAGVGKTSTINALFGTDWKISHTEGATKEEHILHLTGSRGSLDISDLPGLGED